MTWEHKVITVRRKANPKERPCKKFGFSTTQRIVNRVHIAFNQLSYCHYPNLTQERMTQISGVM